MNDDNRLAILKKLEKKRNHNQITLSSTSEFEFLISVILSAQATDSSVNKATLKLYKEASSPSEIIELGEERLKEHIKTIGLFNNKANNIIKTCHILIEKHDGRVPESREELEALPGVGRKTANVVLNTLFKWPVIAIDTHVFRVCNRTGFSSGKNVTILERNLMRVVPQAYKERFHNLFVYHGRHTCQAKKPRCGSCAISNLCEYESKFM
jgi:endonuclease-3